MSTKFIKIIIAIIFASLLIYYFNQESDDNQKIKMDKSSNLITLFDKNTMLYSDDFIQQFKMNSGMNEHWLGLLIRKNGIYELHHFTLPVGENSIDYNFDISKVSEMYICRQHIDYFEGEIVGTNSKINMTQFQLYTDTSAFETSEITGSYFKGIIDVYDVDLDSVTDEIVFKYYPGNTENTPIETWRFSLKN